MGNVTKLGTEAERISPGNDIHSAGLGQAFGAFFGILTLRNRWALGARTLNMVFERPFRRLAIQTLYTDGGRPWEDGVVSGGRVIFLRSSTYLGRHQWKSLTTGSALDTP